MALRLYLVDNKHLVVLSLANIILLIPGIHGLASLFKSVIPTDLYLFTHEWNIQHPSVSYLSVNDEVFSVALPFGHIHIPAIDSFIRLLKLSNRLDKFLFPRCYCIAKAYPSNCTTFASIAKVNLVTFIPSLNRRNNQSNLTLVVQAFGGVVHTSAIDGLVVDVKEVTSNISQTTIIAIGGNNRWIAISIIINLKCFTEIIAIFVSHMFVSPICPVGSEDRVCFFFALSHQFVKLFLELTQLLVVIYICIFRIRYILNLNLVLPDVVQHLILRQHLASAGFPGGFLFLQPVRESHPLVFTSFQSTVLFNHLQPLFWRSLLLLDILHSLFGIAIEWSIVCEGETNVIFTFVKPLTQRNKITFLIIGRLHQLAVVRSILVGIALAIIITPFVDVITIPPNIINRNFLLDDTTFLPILQTDVLFCIFSAWSYPITVSERVLLDVSINGTVHLDGALLSIDCICKVTNRLQRSSVTTRSRDRIIQLPSKVIAVNTVVSKVAKRVFTLQRSIFKCLLAFFFRFVIAILRWSSTIESQ